jgi:hypothetical protein
MDSFQLSKLQWDCIVESTNECSYEEVRGLRSRLFLDINRTHSFISMLKHIFKLAISMFQIPEKRIVIEQTKKILFYLPYNTGANINSMIPIIKSIKEIDANAEIIKTRKLPFYDDALEKESIINMLGYIDRLKNLLLALKATTELINILKNNGGSLPILYDVILYNLYVIFASQCVFSKVLSGSNINKVVSSSDYFPIDYALFASAKKCKIQTFVVQHGIVSLSFFPFTADKIFVYGEYARQEMLKYGCEDSRIIKAGMPSTDLLFSQHSRNENLGIIPRNRVLILSETQGDVLFPDVYASYAKILLALVKNTPDWEFSIKLHPSETDSFYMVQDFEKYKNLKILSKSTSLIEAFQHADIALTIWSTAGLEAMAFGLPLIVIDSTNEVVNYAWWPKEGGGMFLSEIKEKYGLTMDIPSPVFADIRANQEKFLNKYFSNRGSAAEYIGDIVEV